MKVFTIETETNNITVHATMQDAEAVAGAERFRNEAGLAKLAASWPAARLIEIWNSLPGATPVKKFKDRNTAAARIWKAVQSLVAIVVEASQPSTELVPEPAAASALSTPEAPQSADVAPLAAPSTKKATRAKKSPKSAQDAKGSRQGSKTAAVLELLKRDGGVTSKELMEATGWQPHSVRGFLSGTVGKKMGLTVTSVKGEDGGRTYSIKA